MVPNIYGWCGKILKVDLSNSRVTELETMAYADRFLGGRGIATRIYWESVGPEVGALDPENHLILMSDPLGATGAQGASRFEVVGKSPMLMPEGFCYGNLGGFFGPYLKRAGYDGVVITGRSEKPMYLWIHDGKAEILDASFLWGKGVYAVQDILKKKTWKECTIRYDWSGRRKHVPHRKSDDGQRRKRHRWLRRGDGFQKPQGRSSTGNRESGSGKS